MTIPANSKKLIGEWRGINRLHLPWIKENPVRESESKISVDLTAKGTFLKLEYDWFFEGEKQEGLILLGSEKDSGTVKAFWIDSWHLSHTFMVSEGLQTEDGGISVKGFYSVPEHPDWGWRTVIETDDEDFFKVKMFNISPDGEETLAVETEYRKQ